MKLNLKVPTIIASSIVCFMLGIIVGILTIAFFGDRWGFLQQPGHPTTLAAKRSETAPAVEKAATPSTAKGGSAPGGNRGPNAKTQLAALIGKLDQLSRKPLAIHLSDDQRKALSEQLQGLDDKEELAEEDAKKRLDAVLEIVKREKETLEAAGFRWPGQQRGGGRRPATAASNPFKEAENGKHLQALQEQLTQAKSSQ